MKNTFIQITLCWLIVVFSVMGIGKVIKGEDNKTLMFNTTQYGWPSQVVYDTIGACYQGTYKWIVMANPALIGTIPPPPTQRAMIEHCFCVLDRIRIKYSYVDYAKIVFNPSITGELFYQTALECVEKNNTLNGIILLESKDNATVTDNETIIDNSTLQKEEPKKDSKESLPDQPRKRESLSDSETIFQG